jgi:cation/acetate symporter
MGELLSAVLAGGAFAAFLSTASGLTISVAGVIEQDLLRGRLSRVTGDDATVVQGFRLAALLAIVVPYAASRLIEPVGLATMVSLAFAVAASTFCPLLVLGAWWRRLSTVGAAAGLLVGGTLATLAVGVTVLAGPLDGWPGALLGQPAAWTLPAGCHGTPPAPWCGYTPPKTLPSTAASPAPTAAFTGTVAGGPRPATDR